MQLFKDENSDSHFNNGHKNRYSSVHAFLALTTAFSLIAGAGTAASTGAWGGFSSSRDEAITNLKSAITAPNSEAPRFIKSESDGALIFLGASPNTSIPVNGVRAGGEPGDLAKTFLSDSGTLFHEDDPKIGFSVSREKTTGERSYVRMNQTYGGIPVFGAASTVQCSTANSGIEAVASDIMRMPSSVGATTLNLIPTIDADTAREQALAEWQVSYPDLEMQVSGGDLMIYCPSVVGNGGDARLVWKIMILSKAGGMVEDVVLWDAHTGEVAFTYSLINNAKNRNIYDSNNTSAAPGTLARGEGQGTSGVTDVNLAYDYFGDTYDFYMTNHQRDSIDGLGLTLSATVRYCDPFSPCPYSNAFWSGGQRRMYFGQGFAAADDVVGHELTHGVTSAESGLIYANQSGAINESFSDMWGEWIDQANGTGTDTPAVKWYLGEDVPGFGAIRYMAHPPQFGDPDRMGSPLFYKGTADGGGVHWNSGVGNKLCFLLTDGGSFNGQSVTGFGISKTAKLFYEVQTNLLFPAADYADLYLQLKQAAINLNYSETDRDNLERACKAVEIHNVPPPPVNDDFVAAIAINGGSGTELGTNARASKEIGEPVHAGVQGGRSVWWSYTAQATGLVNLNTNGSNFDTLIAVYTGTSVGALTPVAANDDNGGSAWSKVSFSVTSGTVYMIAVDGYRGSSGNVKLNYAGPVPAAPSNDIFAGARAITGEGTVLGTTDGATTQTGEPNHGGNSGGKSVWWAYTAQLAGPVTISTEGSTFDTILAVYTGNGVTSLSLVASSDNVDGSSWSQVSFTAPGPMVYRVVVDGPAGAYGDLKLNFTGPFIPAPANDSFSNPVALTGSSGNADGTNLNATKEPNEPNHGDKPGGRSAWWTFNASGAGTINLSTNGSNFDTVLAVYTGTSIDNLIPVSSNDDAGSGSTWSYVTFTATAGTTYYVAIDGFSGAYGDIKLTHSSSGGGGGGGGEEPEGADLVPGNASFGVIKGKLSGTLTVENAGIADSGKTGADVYFSTDGQLSGATLIKSLKLSKLKPQKVKKLKVKAKQPLSWSGGYVIVVVDPLDLVTEQQESNNTLIYGPLP